MKSNYLLRNVSVLFFIFLSLSVSAQQIEMKITKHYLNIPIQNSIGLKMVNLIVDGKMKREFPVQLADDSISSWIFIDVSEFKGQKISIASHAKMESLKRIYQDDQINGVDSLYKESNRPQFHFTVKCGWSNDVNGPIYYNGQYHLFWQSFPFGLSWNTGFMYWGHATSKDLLHWEELDPALMLDTLGSPWSGTATIDKNNNGGWGKNALVIYYCNYDRVSFRQAQCIAYSTDNGKTFTRYKSNPVVDSDWEMGSTDTRDPKVFWHEPSKHWVMVLFEKDGMSFYISTDMRHWEKQSHVMDLWECPDFFELSVDGNNAVKKWVLHGGSSDYFIGTFDGKTFTPETKKLRYTDTANNNTDDVLYAAESFENMPDGRRVQMGWGRVSHEGMPFTQMMMFPTEFNLITTKDGIRLRANPIKEIDQLHKVAHKWNGLSLHQANEELGKIKPQPLHIKMKFTSAAGNKMSLRYQGNEILNLAASDFPSGENEIEILIDKTVAEIFINKGEHYFTKRLQSKTNDNSFEFDSEKYGPSINSLEVYEMKSIWEGK